MSERKKALARRRAALLLRTARQREKLSGSLRAFDARLHTADDGIVVVKGSFTRPLVAGLVVAAWLALRREAAPGPLVRGALLLSAARRISDEIAHQRGKLRKRADGSLA